MAVVQASDYFLLTEVADNPYVILKYHSDECGTPCQEFIPVYQKLSDEPRFEMVVFLRINVDNNPVAKKYVMNKKQPIITTYLNGSILESTQTSSREDVEVLLERLLSHVSTM